MAWVQGTGVTKSWSTDTARAKTYTDYSTAQPPWVLPSPQPETTAGGIDFELQFHDDYPMLFSADRPLLFQSSISQGNP